MNTIDDEASIWLVRLDNGKLSAQSKKELKAWLAADKRHPEALKAMADVWDGIDEALMSIDNKDSTEVGTLLSIFTPLLKPVALAASVSFMAMFLWLYVLPEHETNTYATIVGQQLDASFSDGSVVHLNTNSHIEAEFTDQKRVIRLIKGEALFDVAHDSERPFIVYAGDRLVQAIGTKFVVHLQSENIQVSVTDGKVKMSKVALNTALSDIKEVDTSAQEDNLFIAKGEQVIVNKNEEPKLSRFELESMNRELSWLDGKLVFDNEDLFNIIEEINRYIDVTILLEDPSLHKVKISGRFNLEDSEALVEAIELTFDMQSKRLNDKEILLSKKI